MADDVLLNVVLGFITGGVMVASVTEVADRYGASRGGFLGGLPSTGAVGLFFIGWSQSVGAAVDATSVFPLAFGITFSFLVFYCLPPRESFWPRMAVALILWFMASAAFAASGFGDFGLCLAGGVTICIVGYVVRRWANIPEVPSRRVKFAWSHVVLRVALGGTVVATVVILTHVAGPLVGGIFSAAPAIWTSSLFVANRTHGVQFSRSLTGSFMKSGMLTVMPYGVAVRYLYPPLGIYWGTLAAYLAVSPLMYLAWAWARAGRAAPMEPPSATGG